MQTTTVKGQEDIRAIKSVCVIGAGVMGQAIAAHMINAGLSCTLLDMPSAGSDRNKIANDALKKIQTSRPSLLFTKNGVGLIKTGNIEDDLGRLKTCDLVIEAVFEKMDIKQSLLQKLEKNVGEHTIIASNTSGLCIESMLKGLSPEILPTFFGDALL